MEFKSSLVRKALPWALVAAMTIVAAREGVKYYNDFNKRMQQSMGELARHGLYSGGDSDRNLNCYPE